MPEHLHGRLVRLDCGRRAPYFRLRVKGNKAVAGFINGEGAEYGQDPTLADAVEACVPTYRRPDRSCV